MSRRKVAILGSTGSVGSQALDVIRRNPDLFQVVGLACGHNVESLAAQAAEFHVPLIAVADETVDPPAGLPAGTRLVHGSDGLCEVTAAPDTEVVLVATIGVAGLMPTVAAIREGKAVALASKELLVMTGSLLTEMATEHGSLILPIDSEHSAIWQCLQGEDRRRISKLLLTASGGPFLDTPVSELINVSRAAALNHPNWDMGPKVTIDSATLMNKGLEVIEARWLFGVPFDRIEVVVHPQSIVHSMVEFTDGAVKAQLGKPDMGLPIAYALAYPERVVDDNLAGTSLDLDYLNELTFRPPDPERFPLLGLAREAGINGGSDPAVLCGADLAAVELFLQDRIGFLAIPRIVAESLAKADRSHRIALEDAARWHQLGYDIAMNVGAALAS